MRTYDQGRIFVCDCDLQGCVGDRVRVTGRYRVQGVNEKLKNIWNTYISTFEYCKYIYLTQ